MFEFSIDFLTDCFAEAFRAERDKIFTPEEIQKIQQIQEGKNGTD